MANPQLSNGYTKIANELLEAICRLNISGNEMRILLYIIRRTYGFNKSYSEISLSEISAAVEIRREHIQKALKKLSAKKIIELHIHCGTKSQTISIVKNYEEWIVKTCATCLLQKSATVAENCNTTVAEIGNSTVAENCNTTVAEIGNSTFKEIFKEKKERVKERTPRGDYGNVFLSDDEINKLNQDYGADNIRTYIQKVDNYVQSKGRPYSDYAATLRSWLDKDGIKKSDFDASKYDFVINNF